jgi:thymidylate synthase
MNKIDTDYQNLLKDILKNGVVKETRNGGTISVFGRQIRHNMKDGFPLLTTKKMFFKGIVTELLWFLRGDTNIKYLVDNGCNIWNGDAYKNFKSKTYPISSGLNEFEMEDFILAIKNDQYKEYNLGDLGPIYGKQWRGWKKNDSFIVEDDVWKNNEGWCSLKDFNKDELYIDQIANSINLLKTDPDSRRNRVNAWNVGELDQMVLPPCHTDFQFFTRELSLKEKEWQLEKTNCINDIENDRIVYGHEWEKYIQEQYESIQSSQGIKIPTRAISLMWNQRSVDTFLGLPFNIASYGLLLEIIAKEVNMVPDELIGNLGDVHLYSNHIQQAKEQINREPMKLPKLNINENNKMRVGGGIFTYVNTDFTLENYQSHPAIKAPLSN